jgi:hypothetical protein
MRATCPDCLARAQPESEPPSDPAAQRYADVQWAAKSDRVLGWVMRAIVCALGWAMRAIVCAIVLLIVWAKSTDDREAAARARAKSAATAAKSRTHAPEMVLIGGAP